MFDFIIRLCNQIILEERETKFLFICLGDKSFINRLNQIIKHNNIIDVIDFNNIQKSFFLKPKKEDYNYQENLEVGDYSRIFLSDRRLSSSYLNGKVRPGIVKSLVKKNKEYTEYYIINQLVFLNNLLDNYKINFCYVYAVAGSLALTLELLSKSKKISFKTLTHSRVKDFYLVTNNSNSHVEDLENYIKKNLKSNLKLESGKKLHKEILASKSKVNSYIIKREKKNKFIFLIKNIIKLFVQITLFPISNVLPNNKKRHFEKDSIKHRLFDLKITFIKMFFLKKFKNKELPKKYFYYPLHVEPESSTMVISPFLNNQLYIIEMISRSLPPKHKLVVKEHIPMLGKRKNSFYKKINKFYNVTLINPFLNPYDIIKNSNGTIVISGSSALESIMLNKPVIMFGSTPFDSIKSGITKITDLTKLNEILYKKANNVNIDELYIYLHYVSLNSIEMAPEFFWERMNQFSTPYQNRVFKQLSESLLN